MRTFINSLFNKRDISEAMASDHPDEKDYGEHKWWKEAIVYQIYPASFLSTGSGSVEGWGDIRSVHCVDSFIEIIEQYSLDFKPQNDNRY